MKLIAIILSLFALASCGGAEKKETTPIVILDGSYTGTTNTGSPLFDVDISSSQIEVSWLSGGLLWRGTFPQGEDKIVSEARNASTAEMTQDTVTFFWKDEELVFEAVAIGTSAPIYINPGV